MKAKERLNCVQICEHLWCQEIFAFIYFLTYVIPLSYMLLSPKKLINDQILYSATKGCIDFWISFRNVMSVCIDEFSYLCMSFFNFPLSISLHWRLALKALARESLRQLPSLLICIREQKYYQISFGSKIADMCQRKDLRRIW